jgi:beta-lactamase regulating signal transducer with metallopeptidase domain
MMTYHMASDFSSPVTLYLLNLVIVSLLVGGASLLACRLACRECLPLRHLMLLGGLIALLANPTLVGATQRGGFSLIGIVAPSPVHPAKIMNQPVADEVTGAEYVSADHAQAKTLGVASAAHVSARNATDTRSELRGKPRTDLAQHNLPSPTIPVAHDGPAWSVARWITGAICLIWLVGSCCQLYWLAKGLWGVAKLLRSVRPIDDPQVSRIAQTAATAIGLRRCPPVGQSWATEVPLAVGILRGQVILPCGRDDTRTDRQWMSLLVHEMAHIRRHDLLVGFLQRLCTAIYWWNPIVRWLTSEISCVREQICDDIVVERVGGATGYAQLLVDFACRVAEGPATSPALGVADGSSSELHDRVRRLIKPRRAIVTSLNRRTACLVLTFGLALVLSPLAIAVHVNAATVADVAVNDATKSSIEPSKPAATATATSSKAAVGTSSADAAAAKHEMLKKAVRIVDPSGHPIAGATIKGVGIGIAPPFGASGPWSRHGFVESDPPTVITDASGKAIIPFPRYAIATDKLLTNNLWVSVEHPNFAMLAHSYIDVGESRPHILQTIVLHRGAQVALKAFDGAKPLPMARVHLLSSESGIEMKAAKINADGWLEAPRFSGSTILQLVYLPASGPVMFSEPQFLNLIDGGKSELRLAMKPAISIAGRLDKIVPRPVKRGGVVAQVIRTWPRAAQTLAWRVSTRVRPDGSFQLADLPPGDLQVTAICEGYMAASGKPPNFLKQAYERPAAANPSSAILPASDEDADGRPRPQVFPVDAAHAIDVKMTRTTDCEIRVVDPSNYPIAGAECYFCPNVAWWGWGVQIYCSPMYSTIDSLRGTVNAAERLSQEELYRATTNADGVAIVKNLPPGNQLLLIRSKKFQLAANNQRQRMIDVSVKAGQTAHVAVKMEPIGGDRR